MAITNTTKAKDFTAGAPLITLKGDLRRKKPEMKMAGYLDPMSEKNDMAMEMFGKQLKDLTEDELDLLDEEIQRLRSKFMAKGGRVHYGLGSIFKKIKKGVKGVVKGVKKNPLLALAALNFAPALIKGGASTFFGGKNAMFGLPSFSNVLGLSETGGSAMDALKIGGAGAVITGLLAEKEQQPGEGDEDYAARRAKVNDQLKVQFSRLYPKNDNETPEDYDIRINAMVSAADDQTIDVGEMADGGRVSYASGSEDYDNKFMKLVEALREAGFSQQEAIEEARERLSKELAYGGRVNRAFGSDELVEQASGIEGIPINVNSKGVKELDLRNTGGFIPPVGVKEKADDIPAMLSNNEFVFTADAVRAAGGGSVNKGAQRMYDLMKTLESKVG